jgi:hypothetical protein
VKPINNSLNNSNNSSLSSDEIQGLLNMVDEMKKESLQVLNSALKKKN